MQHICLMVVTFHERQKWEPQKNPKSCRGLGQELAVFFLTIRIKNENPFEYFCVLNQKEDEQQRYIREAKPT